MNPRARAKRALLRERRLQIRLKNRYRRYGCLCGRHNMREEALYQYWNKRIPKTEAAIMTDIIARYKTIPLPPLPPRRG